MKISQKYSTPHNLVLYHHHHYAMILQRLSKCFWPEQKKENWEWNKKKIVCLFKKIPATNIISVYSYTGSMAFGPNVSKPENENWNSYGDSSAGNSLCKNCIFGINK